MTDAPFMPDEKKRKDTALRDRVQELEFNAVEPEDVGYVGTIRLPRKMSGGILPSDTAPLDVGSAASAGVKFAYSRKDHVHKFDPAGHGEEITVITGVSLDEYGLHFATKVIRVLKVVGDGDPITISITDCTDEGS